MAYRLRLHSPWRLWWQSRVAGEPQRVRVFPNFAPLARFAMFSAEQASRLVGAHVKRRRGEGTDFHQMREYRVGRQPAPDRLEGHGARTPPDLARIPGREEPAAGAAARHRPTPARA
jgi:hypothetical protein